MHKNSEIRLISLAFIKARSYLYPILPFEFGIADVSPPTYKIGDRTAIAGKVMHHIAFFGILSRLFGTIFE